MKSLNISIGENMLLKRVPLSFVLIPFLFAVSSTGMRYVPIPRAGQTSQQLASSLHNRLVGASNAREVGQR